MYDRASDALGLQAPRVCTGMACTAYAVIECVPLNGTACQPDTGQNIGNGNTGACKGWRRAVNCSRAWVEGLRPHSKALCMAISQLPTAPAARAAPALLAPTPCCTTGVGNIGHYNDGSHNLGSRNVGSRNVGDFNLGILCVGHRLQGFSLAGPPAILANKTDLKKGDEPTKEEL